MSTGNGCLYNVPLPKSMMHIFQMTVVFWILKNGNIWTHISGIKCMQKEHKFRNKYSVNLLGLYLTLSFLFITEVTLVEDCVQTLSEGVLFESVITLSNTSKLHVNILLHCGMNISKCCLLHVRDSMVNKSAIKCYVNY